MWVRKTTQEKKKESVSNRREALRPKNVLINAMVAAFLSGIFAVLYASNLCHSVRRPRFSFPLPPDSFSEFISRFSWVFFGGFIFVLVGLIIFGRKLDNAALCNKCFTSQKRRFMGSKCECGGEYESLEDWKWVDDSNT